MTEAMGTLIPRLFARHDVPALTADVDPRNAASLRLLDRLGFRETGRAERTMLWGDEWCDSVYLALPRP
jgi:RimJ/RimL family protein N-acetyltransferase